MALELDLPFYRQEKNFTCGSASLRSVLAYYGIRRSERTLSRHCGTTTDGTSPEGLQYAARWYGLDVEVWEETSLEALCDAVKAGRPAIVAIQAWADGGRPSGGYAGKVSDGHWVCVTAVGPRRLVFQDPSLAGARATLSKSEFLRRWQDLEESGPIRRLAIVFPAREQPKMRKLGRTRRMG